jgi:hypothetical protein
MTNGLDAAKTFFDEKLAQKYVDGAVKEVSVEDAMKKLNEGKAVMIDTRGDEATDVSMIKGAMKPEDFLKKLEAGEMEGKELISQCYIGGGSCDWIVQNKEKIDGKLEYSSMKLGLIGAAHAGVPLVDKDGKETKNVHNVGPLKGMFPETHTEIGV